MPLLHRVAYAFDPRDWPWPQLDDVSLARLRAIPIWTMALEVEVGAGEMLAQFAKSESNPLVRQALELQAYEEDRHGRILRCMIDRYGLKVDPKALALVEAIDFMRAAFRRWAPRPSGSG